MFYQKQQALVNKVRDGFFGQVAGLVYTIEYQKRGLPHMHMLIFLTQENKIHTIEDADSFISAEIPDQSVHPQLYEAVKKFMLHGPCSSNRCLDQHGRCSKHFPKQFNDVTSWKENGYPDYKRSDLGCTIEKASFTFDNRHVVPYNAHLLMQFQSHINVETCASIKAAKYIHKYIYKGHDRATLEMTAVDEVKCYLDARYISSVEVAWHILEFGMHLEWPSVYHLPVHLPNHQMVVYDPVDNV